MISAAKEHVREARAAYCPDFSGDITASQGNSQARIGAGLLFLTIFLRLVYVRLITVRLETDLSRIELSVCLRGIWREKRFPLAEVRSATPVFYESVLEYGGSGIRSGPCDLVYIAGGNRAVQLSRKGESAVAEVWEMSKNATLNIMIGFSGVSYVVLALWQNIRSPLFVALFVLVAGYEVIGSHTSGDKP